MLYILLFFNLGFILILITILYYYCLLFILSRNYLRFKSQILLTTIFTWIILEKFDRFCSWYFVQTWLCYTPAWAGANIKCVCWVSATLYWYLVALTMVVFCIERWEAGLDGHLLLLGVLGGGYTDGLQQDPWAWPIRGAVSFAFRWSRSKQ